MGLAVKIKFDNTHNVIQPTFILATRSGRKIGVIPASNISVSDSFNSNFNLEFSVYKTNNGVEYEYWDSLVDFKLVWCKEWDVWFEIYVTTQDNTSEIVKKISGVSVGEAELSQINLYNIEINTESDIARDDYEPTVLYSSDNKNASLLSRIMEKVPHYSISHVDAGITNIQRTFTFDDISIYDAFQEIAEEIGCLFVIDSGTNTSGQISRTVSVYDLESQCNTCGYRGEFTNRCPECQSTNIKYGYGEDTNIFVSKENLAENVEFETDTGSVKNCFRLVAGDDLMTATIMNCNPNGSQYIWHISDEVRKDMSDELSSAIAEYDSLYETVYKEKVYVLPGNLVSAYNAVADKYKQYDDSIASISSEITGYTALMNAYYNTLELYLLLHDTLMPKSSISTTDAEQQATELNNNMSESVAVQDIEIASAATATSAVLAMAKVIVDPRFRVTVDSSTYNQETHVWTGSFFIESYADDEDTATTNNISVTITDNLKSFIQQKIDKALSKVDIEDPATGISEMFSSSLEEFQAEIKKYCLTYLNLLYDACQTCLSILVEQGVADGKTWSAQTPNLYDDLYYPYYEKSLALAEEIKLREKEIACVVGTLDENGDITTDGVQSILVTERKETQKALDFEAYLGSELMKEFSAYRREDTYSNSNYISDGLDNGELFNRATEFIEQAKKEIYKSAMLQHSVRASLENLLVMKEFEPLVDHFSVGNWIRVRVDGEVFKLRLISYTIDFNNISGITVEFSDVMRCKDGITDLQSIIDSANSIASSYSYVAHQASQGEQSNTRVSSWVRDGLNLTLMKIVNNAAEQNFTIDENGVLGRSYDSITDSYDDKQIRVINRGVYLTDDNWETSKTAIGNFIYKDPLSGNYVEAYGVNGEVVVGQIIAGENLIIKNESSNGRTTFLVDKDGVSLSSGNLASDGSEGSGWKIEINSLYHSIDGFKDYVLQANGSSGSATVNGRQGTDWKLLVGYDGEYKTGITSDGSFYSSNAFLSGAIDITQEIDDDRNYFTSANKHLQISAGSERFYIKDTVDSETYERQAMIGFYGSVQSEGESVVESSDPVTLYICGDYALAPGKTSIVCIGFGSETIREEAIVIKKTGGTLNGQLFGNWTLNGSPLLTEASA